ncbi:hypothetical protein I6G79_28910 [Burkholderia plantarii]|nr:hypothetical protein [Burkholderia plantarii]
MTSSAIACAAINLSSASFLRARGFTHRPVCRRRGGIERGHEDILNQRDGMAAFPSTVRRH